MEQVREEHQLNRAAYERQLELTRIVVKRNGDAFNALIEELGRFRGRLDAFGERIDAFGERIDAFGERVDAFGATLEIQREILLRFLDRLDDELPPPQG